MRFKARRNCFINTTRTPKARCPTCHELCDAATSIKLDVPAKPMPKPGDLAMCGSCGAFNFYTPKLRLRRATDEELREIENNPKLSEAVEIAARAGMILRDRHKDWNVKEPDWKRWQR